MTTAHESHLWMPLYTTPIIRQDSSSLEVKLGWDKILKCSPQKVSDLRLNLYLPNLLPKCVVRWLIVIVVQTLKTCK